jgi:hypothetical protein
MGARSWLFHPNPEHRPTVLALDNDLGPITYNVLGKPVMEDDELAPNGKAITDEYTRLANTFLDGRRMVANTFAQDLVVYNKHNLVNSLLTRGGFFALLEAQVITTWAAFETLAADLCIDGKNVSALSEAVVQCANNLIRAVDRWLTPPSWRVPKSPSQDL